ncbi:Acid-sensing ion channel 3 [Amphibalanus amphitrite]|uniref:Acid-sensing ion channel 3 n=2 Tax=Amphibalanus amphitrite TaxID=1232801 RepID=A0A6A4VP66_AMPAM|nr:Acid-sensing ion channel 3 [Amphibalanus amphitrite]KAF0296998.1 Acid-sensing ion channel 3 [Amphibalanus amphitrite]
MLHAAPVPLLDAPSGLRERSFEIFNNQDWVEVDVRMEELRSLNRKSRPCEEDPAYSRGRCLSECQAAAHAREAGCQLEAVWPATAQGLPQCETATQLERLRAELAAPPSCACPRPCRQGRVSAVVQASSRTASDHEVTVTVRVDGDMQVIEESAAYTAGSLLTDFGGNMGLTMGFSLLTIVELLKKITFGCLDNDRVETIPKKKSDRWADSIA